MRFHWLLPSTLSVFLLSSPAEAAKLKSWHFDAKQNRLELKTDAKVQPTAQLIFNPTRLVIDLPGTTLERTTVKQEVGGAIRSLRVGQFDDQTTRVVIELSPGYRLDPQQVKFSGASPSQWTVQLPAPEREISNSPSPVSPPRPLSNASPSRSRVDEWSRSTSPRSIFSVVTPTSSSQNSRPSSLDKTATTSRATVQVERVQVTGDGFFIRTRGGGTPEIQVNRSADQGQINVDVRGATLAPRTRKELRVNRYGVNRIQLTQVQNSPPVVRMTMQVNKNSPNWRATVSRVGGVVLLPTRTNVASNTPRRTVEAAQNSDTPLANQSPAVATIQSVELTENGTQLLINSDQGLTYASGWDRSSASYSITIPNAQLARSVKGPDLNANSPVLRVRLRQSDPRTVVILVQPATGVRIGELNQPRPELLSLQLQRSSTVLVPPSTAPSNSIPIPSPAPAPEPPATPPSLPPKSRVVVIVDPGHGGKDPGAIGIAGRQEKDVILPISKKIAELLEKEGVKAVLTRDSDYFVDLAPRVAKAEGLNANLFVSIHANSMGLSRPDVNGLETYYFDSGQRLARTIHNSILRSVNVRDRGVRRARFYVLRKTSMPSVLVELGYMTGREDSPRLADPAYQNQMAEAIVRGILQYIKQN
ncbi:N-acetylmuramoyl-L-alanine amidase [Chroococcidiopsis sp. CCMEE 29]|uniref:N-acetylmuramoyl-L-alanine amidase n=1 Tax=Chroococcidiopsis sp. CCMEE 29 TaxID=155894 RepID=UPI0020221CA4|nr:N-acetylmuramoyl-L-alanine amidase [Chroococcidiopsis sp. CCMEE 29]